MKPLDEIARRLGVVVPPTVRLIATKTKGKLRAIFEHIDVTFRKRSIRQILQAIFAGHLLDERDPDAWEFAAAAEVVNGLIYECLSWFDPKKQEWKSLQLPLYCAMLDADPEFPEADRDEHGY